MGDDCCDSSVKNRMIWYQLRTTRKRGEDNRGQNVGHKKERGFKAPDFPRLNVISTSLLQLDHPPSAGFGVVNILGYSGNADGVSDQLDLIFHARSQLIGFLVAIDMNLLSAASDDEDRDVTWIQHTCVQDINMPDVEDAAIGFQSGCRILLRKGSVYVKLGIRKPELQSLDIALHVSVQDFRQDVLAHFAQERFDLEIGVHLSELVDDHCVLVLREESRNTVRYVSCSSDQRIFGFVIGVLQ